MFFAPAEDMADFVGDDAGEGAAEGLGGNPEGARAEAGGGEQDPAAIGLDKGQDMSIGDMGDAERAAVRQFGGLGVRGAGAGEADHDEAVEGPSVDRVLGAAPVDFEGVEVEQGRDLELHGGKDGGGDGVFGGDVESDADDRIGRPGSGDAGGQQREGGEEAKDRAHWRLLDDNHVTEVWRLQDESSQFVRDWEKGGGGATNGEGLR